MRYNIFIIFITLIIVFSNCEKKKINFKQNLNETTYISKNNVLDNLTENEIILTANEQAIQYIIINYPTTLPENQIYKILYEFQIEGNFTNSGNREILAFYSRTEIPDPSLNFVYCFIIDPIEENIKEIHKINWNTIKDEQFDAIKAGLNDTFGRPIFWENNIIGYIGDFNNNEKDELYLYTISGIATSLEVIEFDGIFFKNILTIDPGPKIVTINSIDPEKKSIIIKIEYFLDDVVIVNIYIWNTVSQIYEIQH